MNSQAVLISGKKTRLGNLLGRGGEGDVYFVEGRPGEAVKLYKNELRAPREAKVLAMVGSRLSERTSLVAFPLEVATDESGRFAGFIMRLVSKCRPIHELYGPKSRKIQFPSADYRFLVRTAANVARAVAAVHEIDCVIGDFNHSGVLVSQNATVALIDADSFQFRSQGSLHRCIVGTEDFTPPELHGARLSEVERTKVHDHFGLAVAIFQLLAMGRHPYAGRCSDADLSLGEAIAQHRFAFSNARRIETRTIPPPGSIRLQDFPPSVASAFEAAFGTDPAKRPTAAQWVSLLGGLEAELRQCATVPAHFFPRPAGECLWCRLLVQSGIDMFPTLSSPVASPSGPDGFDIDEIWASLGAVVLPRPEDLIPASCSEVGVSKPTAQEALENRRNQRVARLLWCAPILLGALVLPKLFPLWLITGACVAFYAFAAEVDPEPMKKAFARADARVQAAALEYLNRLGYTDALNLRADLESLVEQYRGLNPELARTLAELQNTREARQRSAYLDGFLIRRAKIAGIGPAKTATLASFNVETANDVTRSAVMAVPGFGEAYTAKLLAWRQSHEAKFRYNPERNASDAQAENSVRSAWVAKRAAIQKKLRTGLANLKMAPSKLLSANPLAFSALREALEIRESAKRHCEGVGISAPQPLPIEIIVPKRPSPTRPATTVPHSATTAISARTKSSKPLCPNCASIMRLQTAKKGRNAGKQFWGCVRFPRCKGSRSL
ncbi:hypothetical protein [Pandoraea commovens]|uniref:Protein kinase domain-containing protein n=1 Tax=Pandoraea commovens TaxID=2508289 RepID=A0ABY5QI89_9BURK|nr:hypothetical protein [Pandoraea commovens]UVA79568.1 hypothetical protein NTU39_00530 [Pandoraea commovens]